MRRTKLDLETEVNRLKAENAKLREALQRIETARSVAKIGSNKNDHDPWYALGRIGAEASIALRGHADGPDDATKPAT